jgi:hypothetical protein
MKNPTLPDNLKPENVGEQEVIPELTEEQKKAEIKKIKRRISDLNKKLAAFPNGGIIVVGEVVTTSPEYDKLMQKKKQNELELAKLENVSKDTTEDEEIDSELNALKGGVFDVFPEPIAMNLSAFKGTLEAMQNAKTLEELELAYGDAVIQSIAETDEIFRITVSDLYEQRKLALNIDVTQEQNLNKGDYLISKNPIFTNSNDEIVVIKEVKEGKIVVKEIGVKNPRQKTFTIAQISAGFSKTTEEALKVDEEIMEPTVEEQENSTISKSSIEDFSKNPQLIDKAKENGATMSKKDRLAALKNASKNDNINNCKK